MAVTAARSPKTFFVSSAKRCRGCFIVHIGVRQTSAYTFTASSDASLVVASFLHSVGIIWSFVIALL